MYLRVWILILLTFVTIKNKNKNMRISPKKLKLYVWDQAYFSPIFLMLNKSSHWTPSRYQGFSWTTLILVSNKLKKLFVSVRMITILEKEWATITTKIKSNFKTNRLFMIVKAKANIQYCFQWVTIRASWLPKMFLINKNGTYVLTTLKLSLRILSLKKIISFILNIKVN